MHIISWCFTFVRSFIKISRIVFNLQSRHEYMVEMAMFNVQRAITPKVGKPELRFMCSAHRLTVLYICMKFPENIWNSFQLTEQTQVHGRNGYVQCSKGNNSKSRQTRVTVHVFCTLSHGVLHLCEVWWKYLWWYQSYGVDTNDGSADGWTDRRTLKISDGIT